MTNNKDTVLILSTSTCNTMPVIKSWECLGVGRTEVIYYDKTRVSAKDIERIKPRFVIYIAAWKADFNPPLDELHRMNSISPLVKLLFDGGDPPWHPEILRVRDAYKMIVGIDGNPNWPSRPQDLTLLTPVDQRFFENMPGESDPVRDIHAGICGAIGSGIRGVTFGYLQGRKAIVHRAHSPINSYKGYSGEAASYKDYADFMRRCKIIVNHSMTASGLNHVKGRVVEAGLAGACLLENKNNITPLWLKPGVHYIEYDDKEHAERIIEELKHNPDLIAKTAEALQKEIRTNHSAEVFWKKVTEKLGQNLDGTQKE